MDALQPIIIDTNFWLLPFEKRVDLLGGLEMLVEYRPFHILVPSPVMDELKMMAGQPGRKNAIAAKSALGAIGRLAEQGKAEMVDMPGKADGIIITLALQRGAWVCTNDRELRNRLRSQKVKTIILRDNHKIVFA